MKTKKLYELEVQRLESKRDAEYKIIRNEIAAGIEYMAPINIIKRTVHKAAKSPELKGDLFAIALNYATSYLTNKVIPGKPGNAIKEWLSSFIRTKVAAYVGNNSDDLKLRLEKWALGLLNKISRKSTSPEEKEEDETHPLSKSAA